MNSLNLSPYLFGVGNSSKRTNATYTGSRLGTGTGANGWFQFGDQSETSFTSTMNSGQWWNGIKRIFTYVFAVLLVIGILLLFVHFFIRPVFKWKPGAPGWIPVPGWDDGVLFWEKGNTGKIKNEDLPIQNHTFDYTLQIDLFIQNPLQFASVPRILLTRGAIRRPSPSGNTILGVLQQYNFAVALKPDTNDMIVSVLNKDNHMETAILPNVPIQEPFRFGLVIMEKAMEVYMNGHLLQTTTFRAPPSDVKGDIYPAAGIEANIVRYRNLKIWPRVLSTPEIRDTKPALSTAEEMGAGPIPGSSSCPSPSDNLLDDSLSESVDVLSNSINAASNSINAASDRARSSITSMINTVRS